MDNKQCPVCETFPTAVDGSHGRFIFGCPNCGQFSIADSALHLLSNELRGDSVKRAAVSHAIRKMQQVGRCEPARLTVGDVDRIVKTADIPNASEQARMLLLFIGSSLSAPSAKIELCLSYQRALIGAVDDFGVHYVLKHLVDRKLVVAEGSAEDIAVRLTFDGWEEFDQLKRGAADSRKAFMAMQYGDQVLDRFFAEVFKPAVAATGFQLARLDEAPRAGLIDDHLRVEIITSRFLIADLTHSNNGAYWEAGFAEGLGKPVIYCCERSVFKEQKSHFDTNHHQTVIWDEGAPEKAAQDLKDTIRATLPSDAILID